MEEADDVTLKDVLVLRDGDFGWQCEQNGRPLFIAKGQVVLDAPMPAVGTRGTVKVRAFAFRDLYPDAAEPGFAAGD